MVTLREISKRHECAKMERWCYVDVYPKYLEELRGEAFPMIEIGVDKGKSMKVWRDYIPRVDLVGIDINPECARTGPGVKIADVLGSDFPALVESLPRPRVVVDDGSKLPDQQRRAWDVLWPRLAPGGLYFLEDFHIWNEGGFMYHVAGLAVEVLQTARRKIKPSPPIIHTYPSLSAAFVHAYPGIAVIGKV